MQITEEEYIKKIQDNLGRLTENVAGSLFTLGSSQSFINDNDTFEAIHNHLGSLEIPVSDSEYQETINAIRKLVYDYEKEKAGNNSPTL